MAQDCIKIYYSAGDLILEFTGKKKHLEIHSHTTGILKDFEEVEVSTKGKPHRKQLLSQDKGQNHAIQASLETVRKGTTQPVPLDQLLSTSRVCFAILEPLKSSSSIRLV